jgi:hypothetical protein
VGAREWVGGKLSWLGATASEQDPDPNEMCDLVRVPFFDAPILVARLKMEGIPATTMDLNPYGRGTGGTKVMVHRSDLDAAQAVYRSGMSDKSDESDPTE